MTIDYIIIQAGGKGTRLEHLTANKPKALVPVANLPMIFHIFRKYPDKKYIIIADYKREVLREYLACFADVRHVVVDAGGSGTCGGVRQAIGMIPSGTPFMLFWSDLILPESFAMPEEPGDYIGISQSFPCRWSYKSGEFSETRSEEHGVAGLFIFTDKTKLADVPESGELVRWLQEQEMQFNELGLSGTREFGLLQEYEALEKEKCRPFNKMAIDGSRVIKEPVDKQGEKLAGLEKQWYETAAQKGYKNIPEVYSFKPLTMERIKGGNVYEYAGAPRDKKRIILQKVTYALKDLHKLGSLPADAFSLKDAYYGKTMARLNKIRDLVPHADKKTINVNGRECRNIYYFKNDLERKLDRLECSGFSFIHGDCTFSNIMLKDDETPVLIDPRGYFGHTELYGDVNYDWAKLYYSVAGNYDRFNLKDFRLTIDEGGAELKIASNRWEELEPDFFELSETNPQAIKLLHAVIWLSLTTYAWQDYDSICGAFYNGLYYLEEAL